RGACAGPGAPLLLRGAGHGGARGLRRPQPLPHPHRPCVHGHPRQRPGGGRHGHQRLRLQAPFLFHQRLLRRRGRRPLGVRIGRSQRRALHAAVVRRVPGHDHRRGPRERPGIHPGCDGHHRLARRAAGGGRLHEPSAAAGDPLVFGYALCRVRAHHRRFPDVGTPGPRRPVARDQDLFQHLALPVLTARPAYLRARSQARQPAAGGIMGKGDVQMRTASLLALVIVALISAPVWAQDVPTVKIGAIVTYTGPTSDVGAHYGDGIRDYFRWLADEHGGIVDTNFGRVRVELVWTDDQYNPQTALTALRRFVSEDNIIGAITWGTGANLALMDELNRVQVPALSASFHRGLLDPPGQYNFFISTNYDNHMRVLIDYAVSQHKGSQPPRIAFSVHPSPYGRSPLEAGRTYAEQLGLNVVASQELPADVLDATGQVLELR